MLAHPPPAGPATGQDVVRVLLVEDDDGDAFLVEELLDQASVFARLERVRSVDEALRALTGGFDCVLLDLGLPDAEGLDALHAVVAASPGTAVVCLTGLDAEASGMAAVGAGAQDYLVKGQVDHDGLRRAMQYAVERRRAEQQAHQLIARELQAAENARLERGLLPSPQLRDPSVLVTTRYRPGRDAVLGGDFYDVLETDDGTLYVIIGDVTGHGPDEAALGVSLRIAWRTLVLSGVHTDRLLPVLQQVLLAERQSEIMFTTACMVVVPPERTRARMWLAGHHAPLLLDPRPHQVAGDERGPMLGLRDDGQWPSVTLELGDAWRLVLFTDGWIEGRVDGGSERLGVPGLLALAGQRSQDPTVAALLDGLLERVSGLNGGPLQDDVAVLALEYRAGADK